jgi:hypothetical protein
MAVAPVFAIVRVIAIMRVFRLNQNSLFPATLRSAQILCYVFEANFASLSFIDIGNTLETAFDNSTSNESYQIKSR